MTFEDAYAARQAAMAEAKRARAAEAAAKREEAATAAAERAKQPASTLVDALDRTFRPAPPPPPPPTEAELIQAGLDQLAAFDRAATRQGGS